MKYTARYYYGRRNLQRHAGKQRGLGGLRDTMLALFLQSQKIMQQQPSFPELIYIVENVDFRDTHLLITHGLLVSGHG
jgi:hypothetical protein